MTNNKQELLGKVINSISYRMIVLDTHCPKCKENVIENYLYNGENNSKAWCAYEGCGAELKVLNALEAKNILLAAINTNSPSTGDDILNTKPALERGMNIFDKAVCALGDTDIATGKELRELYAAWINSERKIAIAAMEGR